MSRIPIPFRLAPVALAGAAMLLSPPPARPDTCSGLGLATLTPQNVGLSPSAVAVGDFNRDGHTDVATANQSSVSVLLGDGSGGFGAPTTYGPWTGSSFIDIVADDIDRDGFLDLVVADESQPEARRLRGQAGGSFTDVGIISLSFVPTRLYLADFTRDGKLDLVVVSHSANQVLLFEGSGGMSFSPLAYIDVTAVGNPDRPSAAAPLDFNRDGSLDLALAFESSNQVIVYFGNGRGSNPPPQFAWTEGPTIDLTGSAPRDIATGDIDRDGWPDLATGNYGSGNISILRNSGGTSATQFTVYTGLPIRVSLVDLNHDGLLDLAVLDAPAVAALLGVQAPPYFQNTPYYPPTLPPYPGNGLGVGRFTEDGRADLVTAMPFPNQVIVIRNESGTPCAGTSFSRAPRGYAAAARPASTAAADFDGDGRTDLAVAVQNPLAPSILLLKNVAGHFTDFGPPTSVSPATPIAVATADLDSDGKADVVAALSGPDEIRVFRGDGLGGLTPGDVEGIGAGPSALVIGDFDGNGFPDVAATSEGSGFVYLYLADGLGGLAPGLQTGVGAGPRALVAGDFNADSHLDLAVANYAGNSVSILLGDGDGTFTVGSPVSVGAGPWGIAAADINGDLDTDLVTVNANVPETVSVLENAGTGVFSVIATHPVPGPNPTAVALLDLSGDTAPELAVTSRGNRTLTVFTNSGGTFVSPYDYAVRNSPRAITPIDVDADGRLDLAVPCWAADSVVVLLSRPPVLLEAPRVVVGDRPSAMVAADLDGDGDLDLAVASLDNSVALRRNDSAGGFTSFATPSYPVGKDPTSIVAADFNRDGRIDLALNAPGEATPTVSILFGAGAPGAFAPQPPPLPTGGSQDDLAVGDFDRDGDLDLAVCHKEIAGSVAVLLNDGVGGFTPGPIVSGVGNAPTAIVTVDLDGDSYLDLAVANDDSNDVRILINDRSGGFNLQPVPLALASADTSPVSITAGDFDADGDPDLAAATFGGYRVHVYSNLGGGTFAAAVPFDVPAFLQLVTAADLNLDGKPDLAAVADGLVALRGKGGLDFEPPETWVGGPDPWAVAVGDFNRDGRPDAALANQGSDNVSVLLSTTCLPRRLDVVQQPLACGAGLLFGPVVVEARDDGGNLAACSTGVVKPSIAPGTGELGADLLPDLLEANGLPLSNGVASFTGVTNTLSIDRPGRRYRLQFVLEDAPPVNLPPALTRPFTLSPGPIQIVGPSSFCAGGFGDYQTLDPPDRWDDYRWTVDGTPVAFTPTVRLADPPIPLGGHTLGLTTRLDGCSATAPTRSLFVGDLQSVTLDPPVVVSSVCVDCIGGTKKAIETGGGTPVSRQWGYRTASGAPPIIDLPGETGETYTLKGASFPGPGTYYVVVTTTSACAPTTRVSDEWQVTVVDDVPTGEVRHLAAASRGSGALGGVNRLLWVNTTGSVDEVLIRWNKAPDGSTACLPPADRLELPVTGEMSIPGPVPMLGDFPHTGLVLDTAYCYSVFVNVSGSWSSGRTIKARPFNADAPAPVKWAYATGGTAVAPPTVSGPAIIAMSNDRTVHALTRGSTGGEWPGGWVPTELSGVAHSRSPVVPFAVPLNSADTVLFAVDDSPFGYVHAINARTGTRPWGEVPQFQPLTGPPGGMFTQYGGIRDLLFVGTRHDTNANELRALNLASGALVEAYAGAGSGLSGTGEIGPINGMPAIDSVTQRLYFASRRRGSGDTLFCLDVAATPPVLAWRWSRDLGDIVGSPVLRGGRVYVGTEAGSVYSLNAQNGLDDHVFTPVTLDGPVKGFVFPDRRIGNDDLYFATNTKVWSVSDDGPTMTRNWEWTPPGPSPSPSIVLHRPQTDFLYVGNSNGGLYELSFGGVTYPVPPPHKVQVLGGGLGQIGAPSLDIGVTPKLLIVGSEPGVLYGVEVPFP